MKPPEASPEHAVVVLGCPTRTDGTVGMALERRLRRALEEAQRDPTALLIVTGGRRRGPAEGPVMRDWLINQGVDEGRIVVEPHARHTVDNALLVAARLRGLAIQRITLVSDPFHLKRAGLFMRMALRRNGMQHAEVHLAPSDHRPALVHRAQLAVTEMVNLGWGLARMAMRRRDRAENL